MIHSLRVLSPVGYNSASLQHDTLLSTGLTIMVALKLPPATIMVALKLPLATIMGGREETPLLIYSIIIALSQNCIFHFLCTFGFEKPGHNCMFFMCLSQDVCDIESTTVLTHPTPLVSTTTPLTISPLIHIFICLWHHMFYHDCYLNKPD